MAKTSGIDNPSHRVNPDGQDDATVLASSLIDQVNREDIASMVYIQRDMLSRFEKTNEMLINFNMLSTQRYDATLKEFTKHTQLLFDMKKDLDSIFKRIRIVKHRLEKTYPEAFAACTTIYSIPSEDDDDDDDDSDDYIISDQARQAQEDTNSQPKLADQPLITVTEPKSPPAQDN